MSLDFYFDKIENYKTKCWVGEGDNRRVHPLTDAIIWGCLRYDLTGVTKDNLDEWLYRQNFYACALREYPFVDGKTHEERTLTYEELQQHIGLATNVSPKSRAHFKKRVLEQMEKLVVRAAKAQLPKPVDAAA